MKTIWFALAVNSVLLVGVACLFILFLSPYSANIKEKDLSDIDAALVKKTNQELIALVKSSIHSAEQSSETSRALIKSLFFWSISYLTCVECAAIFFLTKKVRERDS
jgi:uncharacterized protein YpmS